MYDNDTAKRTTYLVYLSFILELRMLSFDRLKLDSDLFTRDDVNTEVNIT